jgi:hypothetical protein
MRLSCLLLALLALASCGTTAGNAALATGLGVAAAGASRAGGGCYAVCVHGTACDTHTGFCEPIAATCTAECKDNEMCEHDVVGDRCVLIDAVMIEPLDTRPADPSSDPSQHREDDPVQYHLFPRH